MTRSSWRGLLAACQLLCRCVGLLWTRRGVLGGADRSPCMPAPVRALTPACCAALLLHSLGLRARQGPPLPRPPDSAFLDDIARQYLSWDVNQCLGDVGQCGGWVVSGGVLRRTLHRVAAAVGRHCASPPQAACNYPLPQPTPPPNPTRHRDRNALPPAAAVGRLLPARNRRGAAAAAPHSARGRRPRPPSPLETQPAAGRHHPHHRRRRQPHRQPRSPPDTWLAGGGRHYRARRQRRRRPLMRRRCASASRRAPRPRTAGADSASRCPSCRAATAWT